MSDFDNEKDYDLDYFSSHNKNKKNDDLGNDGIFDLNAFVNSSDNSDIVFDVADDDDSEISFSNYGKKRREIKKQDKEKNKSKAKKIAKVCLKVLVSAILIGIITGCLVIGAFAVYVFNFVDATIQEDLDELVLNYTTTLYVKDNATGEYVEYQRLHGAENRIWVDFDTIPQNLKNAFVAVEDQRFYSHKGVDWKRTVAAFANMFVDLYSSNQGGSTITQQLVKNLTGDDKQSPMRKIREIMRARQLEAEYEKDTILECYLNKICLAGGIYGVEVAANYYFDKNVEDLTLAECASLASLAKEPEKYRPDKNPKNNKARRELVLSLMLEQGYITEDEYNEAVNEEITVVANKTAVKSAEVNSYFVDAVIEEFIDRMVEEHGFDKSHAALNFYNGGYKIYCTVNPDVQAALESEYEKTDKYFSSKSPKNGDTIQSAMTIVDYEGHIVGMVGGAGGSAAKKDNRAYNRATMSKRQPGSTMKPLAAYSQALQKNLIYYSKVVEDNALERYYPNGDPGPKNWYNYYKGDVRIDYALETSINTIPCKLVKELGVERTYYHLTSLGIDTLSATEDMNLSSLGLGGTYEGITTTQSAAAFAVFGNLGRYYTPTTFTLVTDQYDNTVLSQKDSVAALDENTACIMNHLLQNVVYGDEGTGKDGANFSETMKAYAKTGTSSEANDCWYVGGTPYYVGSCWFGYDESANVYNASLAKIMWANVMKKVHEKLEPISFPESEFVTARYFCPSTGLLATDACPETKVGYYKTNYSLPAACTAHPGELLPDVKTVEEQLKAEEEAKKEQENGEGSNIEDGSQTESNNTQTESENQ